MHAAAELTAHVSDGVLEAIERAAQATTARIGLAAITGVIGWAADHLGQQARAGVLCPACGGPARYAGWRTKTIRTLLGTVQTSRGYHACRACRQGFALLDVRLGTQRTSLSPGLARAAALAGSEMPYAKSFDLIATVTGLDLASTSTLARTTRAAGSGPGN